MICVKIDSKNCQVVESNHRLSSVSVNHFRESYRRTNKAIYYMQ